MVVPGSQEVKSEAENEGLADVFRAAGAEWREAGCSMCIAMNGDQLDARPVRDLDLEPELRGPPGQGRAVVPRVAADRRRVGDHRRRDRPADAARDRGGGRPRRALTWPPRSGPFTSAVIPLPAENVDTDQIVPARYLKVTDKDGLRDALFHDWRYEADGGLKEPLFVMDRLAMADRQILLVGDNFGTGSSREHAPWALVAWGIRAIISTSFADIFRNNALKNGLLPIVVDADMHRALFELVEAQPAADADRRPRGPGRPPARRRGPAVRRRPVRQADAPRGDRRARLAARPRAGDRGLRGRPPGPGRHAAAAAEPTAGTGPGRVGGTGTRTPSSRAHDDDLPTPPASRTERADPGRLHGRWWRRSRHRPAGHFPARVDEPRRGRQRAGPGDRRDDLAARLGRAVGARTGGRRSSSRSRAGSTSTRSARPPIEARVDGRHVMVRLTWWSGVEPCNVLDSVGVETAGSHIRLTIREGADQRDVACIEIAMLKATVVDLGELAPGTYTISAGGDASPVQVVVH